MISLSVLDQSPIRHGIDAATAVNETIELAKLCDELGYKRYWVAEHHNTPAFAGSTPEIMVTRLASVTRHIRIGSGGVMLPHYSPLKVAENFRMLETMFPGRIDLGIGRALGSDARTAAALQSGPQAYDIGVYPQLVDLLRRYLRDAQGKEGFEETHPYKGIRSAPLGPGMPEIWMLGSSLDSAVHAAHMGLPYSFAHFITADLCHQAIEQYRGRFKPSEECPEPKTSIGVSVLCADTEEKAEEASLARNLWALRLINGKQTSFPSLEEARNYKLNAIERSQIDAIRERMIIGDKDSVRLQLLDMARKFNCAEFVVLTISHDDQARRRSYELLSEAFDLKA